MARFTLAVGEPAAAGGARENRAKRLQFGGDPSLSPGMMDSRADSMVPTKNQPPPASTLSVHGRLADTVLEQLWFGDEDPDRPRYEASQSLAAAVARIEGLKPFPVAAQKLLELLADPGYRRASVQAVLETDPSLAARTLNVANSPLFRGLNPCRSIDQAIVRLGARNVRDLALGIGAMSMFADADATGLCVRDHCVGVAAVVRILAEVVLPNEAASLFLGGLMHDVGKLLLLQSGEMKYPELIGEEVDDAAPQLIERAVLGYDHAVLGGHVMKLWRIPDPTAMLVAWHHQPARALAQGGEVGLMVALLRAADLIDHSLALGTELDAAMCRRLGEDVGWSYANLEQGDLRELWPRMRDARSETLAALTG
jgi:HD-like signal output (HDOD) protein